MNRRDPRPRLPWRGGPAWTGSPRHLRSAPRGSRNCLWRGRRDPAHAERSDSRRPQLPSQAQSPAAHNGRPGQLDQSSSRFSPPLTDLSRTVPTTPSKGSLSTSFAGTRDRSRPEWYPSEGLSMSANCRNEASSSTTLFRLAASYAPWFLSQDLFMPKGIMRVDGVLAVHWDRSCSALCDDL